MAIKDYIKKIVDKKFESVINGYSPSNVDSFLDSIISDLENIDKEQNNYINEIEFLKEQIEDLNSKLKNSKNEIDELKKEIINLKQVENDKIEE